MNLYVRLSVSYTHESILIPVSTDASTYNTLLTRTIQTLKTLPDHHIDHVFQDQHHIVNLNNIIDYDLYRILDHYLRHLHLISDVTLNLNDIQTLQAPHQGFKHVFQKDTYNVSITIDTLNFDQVDTVNVYQVISLLTYNKNTRIDNLHLDHSTSLWYKVYTLLDIYINLLKPDSFKSTTPYTYYPVEVYKSIRDHNLTQYTIPQDIIPYRLYKLDTPRYMNNILYQLFLSHLSKYLDTYQDYKLITIEYNQSYYFFIIHQDKQDTLTLLKTITTLLKDNQITCHNLLTRYLYQKDIAANTYPFDKLDEINIKDNNIYSFIISYEENHLNEFFSKLITLI
jgi:hypothetical protein|nr:MAG TPA: hypothetical protein [Caudoviricetes sp.]